MTGAKDEPTTTFATDTPKIMAVFKTARAQNGDKLRGVWIADDVGDAAPAKTKIDEATSTVPVRLAPRSCRSAANRKPGNKIDELAGA